MKRRINNIGLINDKIENKFVWPHLITYHQLCYFKVEQGAIGMTRNMISQHNNDDVRDLVQDHNIEVLTM